jgi:hypothetical protein
MAKLAILGFGAALALFVAYQVAAFVVAQFMAVTAAFPH